MIHEHMTSTTPLMYSSEDTLIDVVGLHQVPTPAPMGPRHRPVGFGEYRDLVAHNLDRQGIELLREEYVLDKAGTTFFGCMMIKVAHFDRPDMELIIGLKGSHVQKLGRGLVLGNQVCVCSNLCFSGDLVKFQTRQSTFIWDRLPGLVDAAVRQVAPMAKLESQRADTYRLHTFGNPRHGDAALVQLHRDGALTSQQLGVAIGEWDEPKHAEHAEDGFTAWRLLQSVTQAQKSTGNMDLVERRTRAACAFLDSVTGIAA